MSPNHANADNINRGLKGAAVLAVASLIAKVLSASYRIPLENLVGDLGFYVYQQIYPLYGILVTFALSGFPVYLARVMADVADKRQALVVAKRAFVALSIVGGTTFLGLELLARPLAAAMGDSKLSWLINSVGVMVLFMPLLACGRGFFQSRLDMLPTAISQVSEQIVRVAVIVAVAVLAGECHWSAYYMGTLAMLSSTAGAIAACLSFSGFAHQLLKTPLMHKNRRLPSVFALLKGLLSEGVLLCLSASLLIILQLVDSFSVKNGLVQAGVPNLLAKTLKGNYDRAQPLVSLGLVLATSFTTSLLPALSQLLAARKVQKAQAIARCVLKLTWLVGGVSAVGMVAIMPALNTLIYGNRSLSSTLAIYVVSLVFAGLIWSQNALLHSLNHTRSVVAALVITIGVKIVINRWCVIHMGISGASVATVVALVAGFLLLHAAVITISQVRAKRTWNVPVAFYGKLAVLLVLMFGSVTFSQLLLSVHPLSRSFAGVRCVVGIAVGVVVFLGTSCILQPLEAQEWLALPAGKYLKRLICKGE